ncbi:Uncharacterised protein [Mycobacteroides abscessus]|nr:Uncharacterised protein [Mycobacteroides abscessus]
MASAVRAGAYLGIVEGPLKLAQNSVWMCAASLCEDMQVTGSGAVTAKGMSHRSLSICHKTMGTADVRYVTSDTNGAQEVAMLRLLRTTAVGHVCLRVRAVVRSRDSSLSGPGAIPTAGPCRAQGCFRADVGGMTGTTPTQHTPRTSSITSESDVTIGTFVRVAAWQEISELNREENTRNTLAYKGFYVLHMYNFLMDKGLIRPPDTPSRYVML